MVTLVRVSMALPVVSMVSMVSMVPLARVIRVVRTIRHIHVFCNVILFGEIAFHGHLVQGESDGGQGQKGQKEKCSDTNHGSKGKCEV